MFCKLNVHGKIHYSSQYKNKSWSVYKRWDPTSAGGEPCGCQKLRLKNGCMELHNGNLKVKIPFIFSIGILIMSHNAVGIESRLSTSCDAKMMVWYQPCFNKILCYSRCHGKEIILPTILKDWWMETVVTMEAFKPQNVRSLEKPWVVTSLLKVNNLIPLAFPCSVFLWCRSNLCM